VCVFGPPAPENGKIRGAPSGGGKNFLRAADARNECTRMRARGKRAFRFFTPIFSARSAPLGFRVVGHFFVLRGACGGKNRLKTKKSKTPKIGRNPKRAPRHARTRTFQRVARRFGARKRFSGRNRKNGPVCVCVCLRARARARCVLAWRAFGPRNP
jgi:hypothetical protein